MRSYILIITLSLISTCKGNSPLQLTKNGESLTSDQETFKKVIRVPDPAYRLPTEVLPYHYDLRLRPRLTSNPNDGPQWTAPANVKILVTCVRPTRNITLHSTVREIDESSVTITNLETGLKIPVDGHSYVGDKNFYVITAQSTLQIGQRYSIEIDYIANVHTDRLDGLYRSHYDEPETGMRKWYATTQLQAFGARSVFPCFDEPALKATFNVTIGRESNFSVVANTPLINTVPIPGLNGWYWDTFKKTATMSTYLIALVISDYGYAEAPRELYHKPTRTYGPKYLIDQGHGDYAAKVAAKDLAFMSEFFDYDYALDKMDSAAMWDFAAGAMENWGLNIYREYLLLYNPAENTERERRQVAQTLAHELAHQWTGNLLTCAWWTGAWLNEGFATYMQYLGLNHTDPEFESLKTMQNDAMQNAMRSDVLPNSHPTLLPDKGNPYDTMSYSANLVYSKGGALLRMVENFLTMGTLQKALRAYMKRYAFGAVVQDELFEVLDEHAKADNRIPSRLNMKRIMDTWTLQKSYPLVKVRLHAVENIVTASQEEDTGLFKGTSAHTSSATNLAPSLWDIPLAVATQSQPDPLNTFPKYWLTTRELSIPHNSSEWIVLNSGATGYYRVEYDGTLTARLHEQIEKDFTVLNYGTRSQLIDDYFTRAFTGHQQIGAALGFTKHFANELEYVVWSPFFFHMAKPYRLFSGSEVFDEMKEYVLPKIASVMGQLERKRDVSIGIDNLLHAQLADWACGMGQSGCVNLSLTLFEEWKQNPERNPVPPILRPVVYCTAVANSPDNFEFALDRFVSAEGTQKSQLLTALGCTKDEGQATLLLGAADGSSQQISKQFALAALQSLAANHLHREKLSQFLDQSIGSIVDYYGDVTIISNVLRSLSSYHNTAQELAFVTNLVQQNSDMLADAGVDDVIDAAIKGIEENILWMARFRDQFHNWFKANK